MNDGHPTLEVLPVGRQKGTFLQVLSDYPVQRISIHVHEYLMKPVRFEAYCNFTHRSHPCNTN